MKDARDTYNNVNVHGTLRGWFDTLVHIIYTCTHCVHAHIETYRVHMPGGVASVGEAESVACDELLAHTCAFAFVYTNSLCMGGDRPTPSGVLSCPSPAPFGSLVLGE